MTRAFAPARTPPLENYLSVDAGAAWDDHEDPRTLVEALVLIKLEVNPAEAGVVCTFAQEWNRLASADLIANDVAKAVVGIVEALTRRTRSGRIARRS